MGLEFRPGPYPISGLFPFLPRWSAGSQFCLLWHPVEGLGQLCLHRGCRAWDLFTQDSLVTCHIHPFLQASH